MHGRPAGRQLYTCNGTPAQQFVPSAAGDLVNVTANKCVDIMNINPELGARLHLWTCVGAAQQKWARA